ncbi:helix-turn-helix transcriptional regulator [Gordonia sp. TBRC 11910]|uniref:Helix-turn-helix transcriptional regulator n=1 Tax=Gordonia asplenii TaxID=2725283 RepID=A0A848KR85_9ACTN|nr:helix-turn-helix transcriptional regulator [Gordonia asplenii]NMO00762.1 helix-turn-helix transcriptional regulator [Gordonia asplenii]
MTSDDMRRAVAHRVAALRAERGLSLSELARRAGIGKGSLSELEAGQRNPTLDTLYAIAGQLGVPLTALLGEQSGTEGTGESIDVSLLHVEHHDDGATTEVFWLRLTPNGIRTSPAHGPGVIESLYVATGSVSAGPTGNERPAGPGETVTWVSDVAHTYRSGPRGTQAVLTIHSPG